MAMQPANTNGLRRAIQTEATAPAKNASAKYVETVREGAIGAGIFRGQNSHFFALSRAWKNSQNDKSGYSTRFYPGNAEAIIKVVEQAVERCQELDRAAGLADKF